MNHPDCQTDVLKSLRVSPDPMRFTIEVWLTLNYRRAMRRSPALKANDMEQAQSGRLAYIDGWRVIAVACVIIAHLGLNIQIGAFYKNNWIGFISDYGEVGVFIFFFISGHVVSKTCLKETYNSNDFSTPAFYIRRVFRIAPPLILYLTTCLFLGIYRYIDFSTANFLSSASYLCNSSFVNCGWYGGHTWSLAFEEQFYLLFPLIFSFVELRMYPNIILTIFALVIAFMPFVFSVYWIGKTGFIIIHVLFLLGYMSAKHADKVVWRLARYSRYLLILAIIIVFFPTEYICPSAIDDAHLLIGKYYKFSYIFAVPMMVICSGINDNTLKAILSNAYISRLGRATYSIYLWQQLLTGPALQNTGEFFAIGSLVLMIIACVIMYELVETKFIKIGRSLSKRMTHSFYASRYKDEDNIIKPRVLE